MHYPSPIQSAIRRVQMKSLAGCLCLLIALCCGIGADEAGEAIKGAAQENTSPTRPYAEDIWKELRERASTAVMRPVLLDPAKPDFERYYCTGTLLPLPGRRPPFAHSPGTAFTGAHGSVKLLDVAVSTHLAHLARSAPIEPVAVKMTAEVEYEVVDTSDIALSSDRPMAHWLCRHMASGASFAMYSEERIDLSRAGRGEEQARFFAAFGARKGLCAVDRHFYSACHGTASGRFHGYAYPHSHWFTAWGLSAVEGRPKIPKQRYFTLANLKSLELQLLNVRSTWRAGDEIRVDLGVKDADGELFPVVGARLSGETDTGTVDFKAAYWPDSGLPREFYSGTLPSGEPPSRMTIQAECDYFSPDGERKTTHATARFARPGKPSEPEDLAREGCVPPRRRGGGAIEQGRILFVRSSCIWPEEEPVDMESRIGDIVDLARKGRFNTLMLQIPLSILYQHFLNRSDPEFLHTELALISTRIDKAGLSLWFWINVREQQPPMALIRGVGSHMRPYSDAPETSLPCLRDTVFRDRITEGTVQILRRYRCKGFALDGLRWKDLCVCSERCSSGYKNSFDRDLLADYAKGPPYPASLVDWQEAGVTDFLAEWSKAVRAAQPGLKLGAVVLPVGAPGLRFRNVQGQAVDKWVRDGHVDFVFPVLTGLDPLPVVASARDFEQGVSVPRRCCPLLMTAMLSCTDSPEIPYMPLAAASAQVEHIIRDGAVGLGFFSEYVSPKLREYLRCGPFAPEAVPPW